MPPRRKFLIGLGGLALISRLPMAYAAGPAIKVTKDPSCGCCSAWADHLRGNGFDVTLVDNPQINQLKAQLGVPASLRSCHTAVIGNYVIEGHVPAASISRLLRERPDIKGLAVAGMPAGSPGMEISGTPAESYEVIAFGPRGNSVFARFEGLKELPNS